MIYHILRNPLAGSMDGIPPAWQTVLTQVGHTISEHSILEVSKDYPAFFASLSREDTIILHGGDGTINRFINDTEGLPLPCALLYAPGGTGNDFLRDLDKAPECDPFPLLPYVANPPAVDIQEKHYRFLNNVGFGIDGYCCEVGDAQKLAKPGKKVNYTAIAIRGLLFHYKPTTATVIVDGKEYVYKKAWLAPTMKGRFYGGGMNAAPAQNRLSTDGKLSVMVFHGKGRLATLMAFPSIFKGEHVKRTDMVAIHEGYDIRVKFDSSRAVQIDGETILGVSEYHAYAVRPASAPASAEAAQAVGAPL